MFTGIGTGEILVILLVALLVFGGKQLPQVARKLGKVWNEFQHTTQKAREEIQKILDDEDHDHNLKG